VIKQTLLLLSSLLLTLSFGKSLLFSPPDIYNNQHLENTSFSLTSPNDFCDGTLGENIFTDGDFGSGILNILASDVNGYAPGYDYQVSPPPIDGFYTITNNTSSWGSFAVSWVNVGDNSSDPNGYMMVVNASVSPGTFYEKTINNLCEGTLYQFSADAINLLIPSVSGISPNIDFLINGVVQYSTGAIPQDGQWNTYGFTFTTDPGTTSLDLAIRNNAPGGSGNDLAIDNISFRTCGPEIIIDTSIPFICDGETAFLEANIIGGQYLTPVFQWQISTNAGLDWNDVVGATNQTLFLGIPVAGNQYRLIVSNSIATIGNPNCRVTSNAKEIEITPILFTHFDTICQGLEIQVGNSIYNSSGIYLDSLISTYNCDSIVTTYLEVVLGLGITADVELINPFCPNDENGSILISNVQNGGGDYLYALDNASFQVDPLFENLSQGEYLVSVLDQFGCQIELTAPLIDPPALIIDLGDDLNLKLGDEYSLDPLINFPPENIVWIPSEGLSCSDCINPIASTTSTTTYQVTVTDSKGCAQSDDITINIDNTRNVFIPNAFSPNGDGYNDYFTIYGGIDVAEVINFQVYSRWGSVVFSNKNFQPNDNAIGWNGFFKGKNVNTGVYIYTAEILFKDGLVEVFSGNVTVVE
jgi:gliding motility-associated-like protein